MLSRVSSIFLSAYCVIQKKKKMGGCLTLGKKHNADNTDGIEIGIENDKNRSDWDREHSGTTASSRDKSSTPREGVQITSTSTSSAGEKQSAKKKNKRKRKDRKGKEVDDRNGFSKAKLEALFAHYAEKELPEGEEAHIGPNGIEMFCADLGVDPSDVVLVVLSWHLKAQEMGYYY